MKYIRITLILVVALLFQQSVFAQYGFRQPERGNRGYTPPPQARPSAYAERPKDGQELVAMLMPYYVEKLQLDDFKKEILKNMLIKHYDQLESLRVDTSMKYDQKQYALSRLEEKLQTELESIFSADEVERFKELQQSDELRDAMKSGKKNERKKKKRKRKNDTNEGMR
ncbi:MAG: hypothetical protein KJP09_08515 [Bacteroidia bacterium]|nr:hypothetical protein [Bacteroidia bacterium]NND09854.1 hypothetical protein [Flavobacteriaceae bacterium]MBT8309327.1 hypothetical protein [Bacteroidia bacterium]NNK27700.1 hypothetical protein [Flavobacteriaceae bacterium]NNL60738.1 hypothetical protein [Flavobacteriaceae bacterium]